MNTSRLVSLLAILFFAPLLAHGQPLETLKAGVVKLEVVKSDGLDDTGAGIVVGLVKSDLFVLTAYHVVEDAESIRVYFDSERWNHYEGGVLKFDDQLDVAVVLVRFADPEAPPTDLPKYQTRTGDPRNDEKVTAVGHPSEQLEWHHSAERVAVAIGDDPYTFLITRNQAERGFSGGPVFDQEGALLGIVISLPNTGSQAKVLLTEGALRQMKRWKYPVNHLDAEEDDVAGTEGPAQGPEGEEGERDEDPEVAAGSTGTIVVKTRPSSTLVSLDRQTPVPTENGSVTLEGVEPGDHVIYVTQRGYKTWRDAVEVKAGGEVLVSVQLQAEEPATPTSVEVPQVVRQTRARAESILERSGLRVGEVSTKTTTGTPDMVLDQDPRAGTTVRPGTPVDLVVTRRVFVVPRPRPLSFQEDCVSIDYANAAVKEVNGRWKIVAGNRWLFDFESSQSEARQTYYVLRNYRVDQSCFVGRPDPPFSYVKSSGRAPSGSTKGEDCIGFNASNLKVEQAGGRWKITDGRSWLFDFGSSRQNADRSLEIIRYYGFTHSCFVGRPGPSFKYLRK